MAVARPLDSYVFRVLRRRKITTLVSSYYGAVLYQALGLNRIGDHLHPPFGEGCYDLVDVVDGGYRHHRRTGTRPGRMQRPGTACDVDELGDVGAHRIAGSLVDLVSVGGGEQLGISSYQPGRQRRGAGDAADDHVAFILRR
jgi:hypothetical protein